MSYIEDIAERLHQCGPRQRDLILNYAGDRRREGFSEAEALLRGWLEFRPADEPLVVNRHHLSDRKPWPKQCLYIGRPDPLCNPFAKGMTPEEIGSVARQRGWRGDIVQQWIETYRTSDDQEATILELHRQDLWSQLKRQGPTYQLLLVLPSTTALVCSCASSPNAEKSSPCHGFTLVKAWRWLQSKTTTTGERHE